MKTFQEIRDIISQVKCEPYEFRFDCFQCVRNGISAQGIGCADPNHTWFLQATLERQDTHTGQWGTGFGGKQPISPHMVLGEIVKRCFVACRDYAEHEVREAFMFRGRRVLGPHIDMLSLWEIAKNEEVRDKAPTPVHV